MDGQGWLQISELLLAFTLSSLVGLERQLRGKAAGLRTQALVGTTSALLMLVSKYGFNDVLLAGHVVLDPSRVAAQIVTGVGFLGAGLILTRQGNVKGLTTAAAVWETAAIGMAAGAGLWLLALVVTFLHFVTVYAFTALTRRLPGAAVTSVRIELTYVEQHDLLRTLLGRVTELDWKLTGLSPHETPDGDAAVTSVYLDLSGNGNPADIVHTLAIADGVRRAGVISEEELS